MNERRTVVVVAHPDDESLWFGGALQRLADQGVRPFLVCLTNRTHPVRAPEFAEACRRLGTDGAMLDWPDGGQQQFPDDVSDLAELVRAHGIVPEWVVSHPPHGNERSHPQHLQAWSRAARWAAEEEVALGFFSERPVDELRLVRPRALAPGITGARALPAARSVRGPIAAGLSATPRRPRPMAGALLAGWRDLRRYWAVRSALVFDVDQRRKELLLEAHPSQVDGMREYAAFTTPREFLYLFDRAAARRLPCPS